MKRNTALPSRPLLDSALRRTEKSIRAVQACGAENFNRLKRKDPQKRLQSVSESLRLFVPIGFVPIVVCTTIPNRTCVERKTGAPIGYGSYGT